MDDEVFEDYDRELELALYREYRDVVSQFQYVIETERRFYLANEVNVVRRDTEHDFYFEISMTDVWVWDIYRADRFVGWRANRELPTPDRWRRSPQRP